MAKQEGKKLKLIGGKRKPHSSIHLSCKQKEEEEEEEERKGGAAR